MKQVKKLHEHDQNFPGSALERITEFLNNPDVLANPNKHYDLITEMKLEALLVTENSPYGEVRANVENTDDPTLPSLTLRVWVIGVLFSGVGAFINELFAIRNPSVYVTANVAQLLACEWYPLRLFCLLTCRSSRKAFRSCVTRQEVQTLWQGTQFEPWTFQQERTHAHHHHGHCGLQHTLYPIRRFRPSAPPILQRAIRAKRELLLKIND